MQLNQPLADEIRSMYRSLREHLKRLRRMAPADTFDTKLDNDGYALTWRSAILGLNDARCGLDHLAMNYEEDEPQDVLAENDDPETIAANLREEAWTFRNFKARQSHRGSRKKAAKPRSNKPECSIPPSSFVRPGSTEAV